VEIERVGKDPKTGAVVTGKITKTIYPKDLSSAEIDAAGDAAFKAALEKQPGSKLDAFGSKLKKDGTPADGAFEATIRVGNPPRDLTIQGWFKQAPDGTKTISSHAPASKRRGPRLRARTSEMPVADETLLLRARMHLPRAG
jgi:hypothetical protein